MVVIEMNPRVSRSSALASKATGFPIAKIATKLAIGYTLDEIPNDITGQTPASFEPALDYVVVKIPRFAFEKFPGADTTLTTHMKSVGEAMAIGRSFAEALQKAQRSLESPTGPFDFGPIATGGGERPAVAAELLDRCRTPHDGRLNTMMQALRAGATAEAVAQATGVDPWFVDQLVGIRELSAEIAAAPELDAGLLRLAKENGFSDVAVGQLRSIEPGQVRALRHSLGLRPVYHVVDTCAAEFAARTPYLYSSYDEGNEVPGGDTPKVIILGSGPNRIGQGIEFDYACVHASFALRAAGYETVMVNCNPETVSTDYDTSSRLYFEPLTLEDVLEVVHAEQAAGPVAGVIVQLGGQTPLGLARALEQAGVPIVGTSPAAIHAAEDRGEFAEVLAQAGLTAPRGEIALSSDEAAAAAAEIGYPVLVRPSYVLGGRGMEIVYDEATLRAYVGRATAARPGQPGADRPIPRRRHRNRRGRPLRRLRAVPGRGHGAHRGGRHPLRRLGLRAAPDHPRPGRHRRHPRGDGADRPRRRGARPAQRAVRARGGGALRARGQPAGVPDGAVRLQGDRGAAGEGGRAGHDGQLGRVAARVGGAAGDRGRRHAAARLAGRGQGGGAAVRPVQGRDRAGVDTVLGPEMRSTGEVMGIDESFGTAYAKSQEAVYGSLPVKGRVFVSVANRDKRAMVFPVKRLADLGFEIWATSGTAEVLRRNGVRAKIVRKHSEGAAPGGEPTVVTRILDGEVDLIVNTPWGSLSAASAAVRLDGYEIRTAAVRRGVPCVTTVAGLAAAVQGIEAIIRGEIGVRSLQEHAAALRGAAEAADAGTAAG